MIIVIYISGSKNTLAPALIEYPPQKPLDWNQDHHKAQSHKGTGPDFLVHEDGVDYDVGWANPKVMEEQECLHDGKGEGEGGIGQR